MVLKFDRLTISLISIVHNYLLVFLASTPRKDIIGSVSKDLRDKHIVLCVCGSVAASESPEICRELMRHGAEVYTVMTDAARKIIHPNLLEWASGNPVVTKLTGKTEHIELVGNWQGKADLVLIAPATANAISKIAAGVDDNPVTTVASVALGTKTSIIIAPGMHEPMYTNPIIKENIGRLRALGVEFVEPRLEEGKAKIASTEDIVAAVVRKLRYKDMQGLRVMVTAGPTVEHIDPVRIITNRSTGKMGVAIAEEAWRRGADVTLIQGPGLTGVTHGIRTIHIYTTEQLRNAVVGDLKSANYDLVVSAAAPADFKPDKPFGRKLSTRDTRQLKLTLSPTTKVIDEVKKVSPKALLVAFKAEYKLPKDRMIKSATTLLNEAGADLVVANDVGKRGVGFEADTNEVYIVDRKKSVTHVPLLPKEEIARRILDMAVHLLKQKK